MKRIATIALVLTACSHARTYPTRAECREPCSRKHPSTLAVIDGTFAACVSECAQTPRVCAGAP